MHIDAVSLDTGEPRFVVDGGVSAFAKSGNLVYSPADRLSELWAVPFDERLVVTGTSVQLRGGVGFSTGTTFTAAIVKQPLGSFR